ncbi:hypothetical protein BGZ49_010819, partial [Haplosporangium sp. Z 27]
MDHLSISDSLEDKVDNSFNLKRTITPIDSSGNSGPSVEDQRRFFANMLADIDSPTFPFGLSTISHEDLDTKQSRLMLSQNLNNKLREHAKRLEVTLASVLHLAWAQVLARTSGQDRVVFATSLSFSMLNGLESNQVAEYSTSILPFRIDVVDTSAEKGVRQTHSNLTMLIGYNNTPLDLAQSCSSIPVGTRLLTSLLNYQHNTAHSKEILDASDAGVFEKQGHANYSMVMTVEDRGDTLVLTAQAIKQCDSRRVCGYMQQALESLEVALDHTPNALIQELEVIPTEERKMLLESWNDTASVYKQPLKIHQIFENQVQQTPDAIALVYEDQELTYRELNARANSLAHHLIHLGVKPDSLVAICVSRSLAMIIGLIAILKAGGAYVPLDPSFASERLNDILADASPSILVADESGLKALALSDSSSMEVVDPNELLRESIINPEVPDLMSHHLAYVIYTSGSTGKPKGVMIEHQGVANLAMTRPSVFGVDGSSRILHFFSFSFDGSVQEIWSALCFGGCLHIISDDVRHDRSQLWAYIEDHSITHATLTPSVLQDCKGLPMLTKPLTLLLVGENVSSTLIRALKSLVPLVSITNAYGPTETTVEAIAWKCPDNFNGDIVPIGRPIPNKKIYVLDSNKNLVPTGAIGELYIGGIGVARGYLNRPDLTDSLFQPDKFTDNMSRMYRTGDLVRYLPDGNLVFIGRSDHQVKIRGFRIELGEIEARLSEHELVKDAVVLAVGEGGGKRLIAYVVAKNTKGLPHTLRSYISSRLPDYMVPVAYVRMDTLPLNSNGKLDRRALPEPDMDSFVSQGYEAPQGEIESTLANIWSDILKVERVGRHDNFFMLGGHSLLAVQMIERLRRIGLSLSVRALFDTPTLSVLAQSLNKSQGITEAPKNLITLETTKITPELLPLIDLTQDDIDEIVNKVEGGVSNIQDIYALSPLQDGILFHHIMATKGDPYLLVVKMSFSDRDSLDSYMNAVQKVVDRHDILRTSVMWENLSSPAQVVLRKAELSVTELSLDTSDGPIIDQITRLTDPREHRIDLTQGPLIRFVVAQDIDGHWIVVQLLHHIIGDQSTMQVMKTEIQMFIQNQAQSLPEPQPYRNLIAQVKSGPGNDVHERFFSKMLAEIDTPALPFGLSDVHDDGLDVTESELMLPRDLTNKLRGHAKRMGVTLASMCHLAWAQVISRTSGQERVVFGTVLFGRMHGGSGSDQAMGLFINTLPIRIDVGGTSIAVSVRQVQADLAALLEHEHASLSLVQRCSVIQAGTPLFSAVLNCRNHFDLSTDTLENSGFKLIDEQQRTNYPFTMSVDDYGTDVSLTSQVTNAIDSNQICKYMQQALRTLADALDDTPNMLAREIEIIPDDEREVLLESWNRTTSISNDFYIHQLFEKQVERTPDAIALVYEDQELTYQELNARANSLAHHLIHLGVKPDSLVAICVSRSLAMIIGLIAILKAGGAYVPLDPTFASERLNDILVDASPSILVADEIGLSALALSVSSSMVVVDPNELLDDSIINPEIPGLMSHHLAYVIYTSGSTGKPKGVMVEHAQVTRLFDSSTVWFNFLQSDIWVLIHTYSFDFSVWEIWGALRYGGKLIIPSYRTTQSPEELYQLVCNHGVTVLNMTPSAFRPMMRYQSESKLSDNLRYIVLAGEALEPAILQSWYEVRSEDSPKIVNMYGPTEITVYATFRVMKAQDSIYAISPIGMKIPDLTTYVLDSHGQLVPLGAVGELCIGGAGVTRGYLNRPELTAEKFPLDPFSKREGARMYKSGDLVRYLPDGNLMYMGRNDDQVKIRGYRIELGEIEVRLLDHPI